MTVQEFACCRIYLKICATLGCLVPQNLNAWNRFQLHVIVPWPSNVMNLTGQKCQIQTKGEIFNCVCKTGQVKTRFQVQSCVVLLAGSDWGRLALRCRLAMAMKRNEVQKYLLRWHTFWSMYGFNKCTNMQRDSVINGKECAKHSSWYFGHMVAPQHPS